MNRTRRLLVLAFCLLSVGAEAWPAAAMTLERVVIVMRHGVRPPTKSAAALASLADQAWPDDRAWGAAPGDLTPHGARAISKLSAHLRAYYADLGLVPAQGDLGGQLYIWADGADERTRATATAFASGFAPDAPTPFGAVADGQRDDLFDPAGIEGCREDPAAALSALTAREPLQTPQTEAGLRRLQQTIAPNACHGGAGVCLSGPSTVSADKGGLKMSGPLATGATLAENLLLEYENGLPADQVGWGRATSADLRLVMPVHDRAADLTRAAPYLAVRHGGPLARLVLGVLADADAAPATTSGKRLVVVVGHDTNLSNLAGVFGLSWTLPDQPDATAPGTALAFERWGDPATGSEQVRVRVFYQTLDQVRDEASDVNAPISIVPRFCATADRSCSLAPFLADITGRIPAECKLDR